jgi:hypothetical protein
MIVAHSNIKLQSFEYIDWSGLVLWKPLTTSSMNRDCIASGGYVVHFGWHFDYIRRLALPVVEGE